MAIVDAWIAATLTAFIVLPLWKFPIACCYNRQQMKKFLLILLILALPLQAFAAMERSLTHVLGNDSGQGAGFFIKHMVEHADHVLHHHDHDVNDDNADDAPTDVDNSQKSFQHLADYEHGGSMNMLPLDLGGPGLPSVDRIAPRIRPDIFSNRTIIPLLRPPRARV